MRNFWKSLKKEQKVGMFLVGVPIVYMVITGLMNDVGFTLVAIGFVAFLTGIFLLVKPYVIY